MTEENIAQALTERFGYLKDRIRMPRKRRLFLDVAFSDFESVFDYAVKDLSFSHLIAITGLDEQDRLGFIYHLAQDGGIGLNLKTSVSKENPVLRTVTGHFAVAQIYERELVDLFGARVEGLPEGERYPLPDGWPAGQYPLRKDWKPTSRGQAHA